MEKSKKITNFYLFSLFIFCTFFVSPLLESATVKVLSFNILAPPWASPSSYPESSAPFLDRELRRARIIDVLNSMKDTTDIIALQEITRIEFGYIQNALKGFVGIQANHDPDYWSQYITENPPWEPNGNAIFIKKATFKNISLSDISLSSSGNHAAYAEAIHKVTNKPFRAFSVHLDSDTGGNRNREIQAAIDFLTPENNKIDLIVGDFNSSPQQGNYANDLQNAGFADVLLAIGNTELTTPFSTKYSASTNFGIIDHVTVRNAAPRDGDVLDFGLYQKYPIAPSTSNEDDRVTQGFQIYGSDHFPIWGSIQF